MIDQKKLEDWSLAEYLASRGPWADGHKLRKEDVDFCISAREAVPLLIDEVLELRAELLVLKQELSDVNELSAKNADALFDKMEELRRMTRQRDYLCEMLASRDSEDP